MFVLTTLNSVLMVASTSLTVSASSLVLNGNESKAAAVDQHVHCSDGNQAAVTGTNDTGLFDISIVMNGCEGVSGSSGFGGTSSVGETRDFTGDFTGSAGGNGCSVSLEALGYTDQSSVWTTLSTGQHNRTAGKGLSACRPNSGPVSTYSVPLDTITAPTSESVTGSISATCTESAGSASVTCDFSGGVDAQSASALTAACACTGDGC